MAWEWAGNDGAFMGKTEKPVAVTEGETMRQFTFLNKYTYIHTHTTDTLIIIFGTTINLLQKTIAIVYDFALDTSIAKCSFVRHGPFSLSNFYTCVFKWKQKFRQT